MTLFRGKREAPARLGCFGKLPTFGDFLSLRQESADAQAYAEWVQQGMAHVRGPLPGPPDVLICFVHHPPDDDRVLLGTITPSADSAGRVFPFSLFVSAPGSALRRHGAYEAVAAEPVWRQLRDLNRRVRSIPGLREQYALLQEASPAAIPSAQDVAESYPARLRALALEHASPGDLALQVRDVARIADELGRSPTMPDFALRMRLHQPADPSMELSVWSRMLFAYADESDACSLYVRVSRSEKSLSAFLCRRPPRPEDLTYLLAPSASYRFADDVGFRNPVDAPEEQSFLGAFQERWMGSPRTCQDLLELGTRNWTESEIAAAPKFDSTTAIPPGPKAPAAPAPDAGDDEITSEIDMSALRAVRASSPGLSEQPTRYQDPSEFDAEENEATGVIGPPPAPAPETAVTETHGRDAATVSLPSARATAARLADSLMGLVGGPLLPGRVIRLPGPVDPLATGALERVFVADHQASAYLLPVEPDKLAELEKQARAHALAKQQLRELERAHRDLEAALERAIEDGAARSRRDLGWP